MISKQNLWFLTLFSLILVLSVYYVTMPSELLLTANAKPNETEKELALVNVEESNLLLAMRVNLDDERTVLRQTLQETMTSTEASKEDKNNAYEQMRHIDEVKGKELELEKKIKEQFKYENFVKIDKNQVQVVVVSQEHNKDLANKIMRLVQASFENKMYITVKFEK